MEAVEVSKLDCDEASWYRQSNSNYAQATNGVDNEIYIILQFARVIV
jgi:hypothetical protein